jgi:ligand-binding sensor domain-containing protein
MSRVTRLFSLLCCCLAGANWCGAQERDVKFHHLTAEEGLPSNTVNGVIRDSRGFIWIATENGVARYDAYSFVSFRAKENDTISISSNITYTLLEDTRQRLWIGSEKGLDLYNRELDRFDKHFFKGIPVRAIYQDRKGRLWVGSDQGLYLYQETSGTFIKPYARIFDAHEMVYNTIPSILEDRHGNLWVGTSNGIHVLEDSTGNFLHFVYRKNQVGSLSWNNVRKIVEDPSGRIWIATYGGGLNLYQPKEKTFKNFRHVFGSTAGISSDLLPTLWVQDNGKIWIGTDGRGIDIFNPETHEFQHIVHSPYNSKSLNNNVVRSISSDQRGGIWVGTYNGGVNFFNQNAESFFHYKVPTLNGNSSVTSFAEEKNGNLWIGTDGGGLCYFDRATGQFANFYNDERNTNSVSDNRILSLMLDHQGQLWIGTYLGGLCRYDPARKKFTRYTYGDSSGLSDNVVWVLLEDSQRRIWVGTNNGINRYDPRTNTFTCININNSNLSNNMIRCLYEDTKRRLWIGTQEGLNLLEEPYTHFTVIKSDQQNKNSLSNHWIRCINQDHDGNLWIGTFAGGLNLYNEASGTFTSFHESDGLPDNIVSGILSDKQGHVWMSTGRGLAYLSLKNRVFKSYSTHDGLQDYQFNINASYETRRGEFLFGGTNGFTSFMPEVIRDVKNNQFPPPIAFTSLKILNKEVLPHPRNALLKAQLNETKTVVLSYDQSVITLEFAALNFIQPEKNEYSYRLAGFEDEWNMVKGKRSATYTNLEPGEYTFQVKASNNDGVWNDQGVALTIVILPPFWQTWWFTAMLAVAAILFMGLIVNIVRNRFREKIRIAKLIAELELKALIAQMNPHFIFNCLTSIQELIIVHKQDEAMHYLHQFSKLLRTVLQSSEKNFISLDQELTLLELYLELESMRFDKQFHYEIHVDSDIDPEEVIIPSFLLQPFVENALWHGLMHKKGERNLRIAFNLESEDVLLCSIADDGIGRKQGTLIRKSSIKKTYRSMGMKIIRERMALMKKQNEVFDLRIVDRVHADGTAAGTTVIVRVPLGRTEFIPEKTGMTSMRRALEH